MTKLTNTLRAQRNSRRLIIRLGVKSASFAWSWISAPAKFCFNRAYRSVVLLRLFRPQHLHQSTPLTWMDRYPKLFSVCKDYFNDRNDVRILSYGCATGEEVVTLRNYFPAAFLVGAEINPHSLSVCRKRKVDDRIAFVESTPENLRQMGPFDAIFCLAVLQRTPMRVVEKRITDLKKIYPFEKFDDKVTELDSCLKTNGLLIIHHSQYSFSDASVAAKYAPLSAAKGIRNQGPQFDRKSLRYRNAPASDSVFVKLQD